MQFQSTLSVRRATESDSATKYILGISIHALREESDIHAFREESDSATISIHALREESD